MVMVAEATRAAASGTNDADKTANTRLTFIAFSPILPHDGHSASRACWISPRDKIWAVLRPTETILPPPGESRQIWFNRLNLAGDLHRAEDLEKLRSQNRPRSGAHDLWVQIRILHLQSLGDRGGVEFVVGGNKVEVA